MRELMAVCVALIFLSTTAWYCYFIIKGKLMPVATTWLLFSLATTLSLSMYLMTEKNNLISNIANTMDVITTTAIFMVIIIFGKNRQFKKFDIGCIVATAIILVFWLMSHDHVHSNLAIQAIITIAYFPTIKFLATEAKTNTESFFMWPMVMIAQILSFSIAKMDKNFLATVYSVRAIILVFIVLALMTRLQIKSKGHELDFNE